MDFYKNNSNIYQSKWIEASAGTGKTTLMVERISQLIYNNIPSSKIICITFTNNAANQIHDRIKIKLNRHHKCKVITIHGLALDIINKYFHLLGYASKVRPIDENTSQDILHSSKIYAIEQIQNKYTNISLELSADEIDRNIVELIKLNLDIDNNDQDIENQFQEDLKIDLSIESSISNGIINDFFDLILYKYKDLMKKYNVITFDQMILYATNLLDNLEVAYYIDSTIDHFMVDELQDTSPNQWELIEKIISTFSSHEKTCLFVGDQKQSIYSHQKVSIQRTMQAKEKITHILKSLGINLQTEQMIHSYRCPQKIIELVNKVYENIKISQWSKQITKNNDEGIIKLHEPITKSSNLSLKVLEIINDLLKSGSKLHDIMILIRKEGVVHREICKLLALNNIDYVTYKKIPIINTKLYNDLIQIGFFACYPEFNFHKNALLNTCLFGYNEFSRLNYEADCFANIKAHDKEKISFILSIRHYSAYNFFKEIIIKYYDIFTISKMHEQILQIFLNNIDKHCSISHIINSSQMNDITYKGNMEAENNIKIMSVHGAKGLQAKHIIMPDTKITPGDLEKLTKESLDEYYRLLYVSLTRTQKTLDILVHGKSIRPESWYLKIKDAIS